MRCSTGHENPDGQRFCGECGEQLAPGASEEPSAADAMRAKWSQTPRLPPEATSETAAGTARTRLTAKQIAWIVVGALVAVAIAVVLLAGDDEVDEQANEASAYSACKDFVEDRLVSPGSASYPDYWDFDGEVVVSKSGDRYTVSAHADSDNALGGTLRTSFTCTVRDLGDRWRLVAINLV